MTDKLTPTYFSSITGIIRWGNGDVFYLDNDNHFPYICRLGRFYYFAFDGQRYNLLMETGTDLNERKA